MYEFFEHTADLGLRARANDRNQLFAEMARALFAAIVENLDAVQPVLDVTINIAGDDIEFLLFDWLRELLMRADTERMVFSQFDVTMNETGLTARCRGESLDPGRHQLSHEVKAITYHGLLVARENDGWLAEAIVDI